MLEPLHGGRVWELARELGCRPDEILDFSANPNPLGPPESVLRVLREALEGPLALAAYPDTKAPTLRRLLSDRTGAPDASLVLGHGGAALMLLALRALAPKRVLVPIPCFQEQPRAIQGAGAELVPCPMPDLRLPLHHLDLAAWRCDGMLLTNPHSPTGQCLDRGEIQEWVGRYPGRALIIDESFIDFTPDQTLLPDILSRPRTVVLRSFAKFYGMPGMRVGYACADALTAEHMAALQEGWPLGQLELLAAEAALRDLDYHRRSFQCIREESPRFQEALGRLGMRPLPSVAPFVLAELPEGISGTAVAAALRPRGILIRTCATWPGLGDRYIRLALKRAEAQDRLVEALGSVFSMV